ncbi:hypothetical protein [Methanococcus maripaludis]|uniref:Uncharacterized protein n=1 Tax=Methanococcus maripaludis TaxID=39152 RepID=A0A7J9S2X4_METMI|nr:hypothetical protein [Methanococcus maripaludis]MBB6067888.1 hypothetical protein [Methanococcus maripaludis]
MIIAGAILVVLAGGIFNYYFLKHPMELINWIFVILFYGFLIYAIFWIFDRASNAKKKIDGFAENLGQSFQNKTKK